MPPTVAGGLRLPKESVWRWALRRAPEPRALWGGLPISLTRGLRGVGWCVAIEIVQSHATELIRCREAECTRSCPPFTPEVSARDGHALVSPRCHSGAPPTRLRLPCVGGGTSACMEGAACHTCTCTPASAPAHLHTCTCTPAPVHMHAHCTHAPHAPRTHTISLGLIANVMCPSVRGCMRVGAPQRRGSDQCPRVPEHEDIRIQPQRSGRLMVRAGCTSVCMQHATQWLANECRDHSLLGLAIMTSI